MSNPIGTIDTCVPLDAETTDDMDRRAFLQFGEILDLLSFPCDDTMSGDINDFCAVLCGVAVVSCDGEVGNFGIHEILHVNAPDDAPDFDFVQMLHDVQNWETVSSAKLK